MKYMTAVNAVVVTRPPMGGAGVDVSAGVVATQAVATFSVPNATDAASWFAATIDWGDGTTSQGVIEGGNGTFAVLGGHTYAETTDDHVVEVTVQQKWIDFGIVLATTSLAPGAPAAKYPAQVSGSAGGTAIAGTALTGQWGNAIYPTAWYIRATSTKPDAHYYHTDGGVVLQQVTTVITLASTQIGGDVSKIDLGEDLSVFSPGAAQEVTFDDVFPGYALRLYNKDKTRATLILHYGEAWDVTPGTYSPMGKDFGAKLPPAVVAQYKALGIKWVLDTQAYRFNDAFMFPSFPNTVGTASTAGNVYYIDGAKVSDFNLNKGGKAHTLLGSPAGILPSRNALQPGTLLQFWADSLPVDKAVLQTIAAFKAKDPLSVSQVQKHRLDVNWNKTGATRIVATQIPKFEKPVPKP